MRLIDRIVLQLFPRLRDRLEECEYNSRSAFRLASVAIVAANKALQRSNECDECIEVEEWPGGVGGCKN